MLFSGAVIFTVSAGGMHVFCGAGDNLFNTAVEPVDSKESIDAMLEWMSKSYGINRLYWRALNEWTNMRVESIIAPECSEWHSWLKLLQQKYQLDKIAVDMAHKHGMEAFLYTGLYEHGLSPDGWSSYQFETKLRIQNPQYCDIDRFGERRAPGTISFTYPEARKMLIDKYLNEINTFGYDGINFYTYVENYGIRYEHEFGFEPAVIARFNEKYPDVDLKTAKLTPEQAEYWYECRGYFTTLFLRELSAALKKNGKKLSMIIDAENPRYCQPWWGMPIRGTGKIRMDYETWIAENIVDEIWVQLADMADQHKTLDMLLPLCKKSNIKLTVRAVNPLDPRWKPYIAQGVTPIAVITWARNGIESYTGKVETPAGLDSANWMVRAQALRDIAAGRITADAGKVAKLVDDPHVLVRRNACLAMVKLVQQGHKELLAVIEKALFDREFAVRIGAATALTKVNRKESAEALLKAVEADPTFQVQFTAVTALGNIGAAAKDDMVKALTHPSPAVRKTAIHGLYKLVVLKKGVDANEIFNLILPFVTNTDEVQEVRMRAVIQIIGIRGFLNKENQTRLIDALSSLIESENDVRIQLAAAFNMRYVVSMFPSAAHRLRARTALKNLFAKYGDDCTRPDAAYGWRFVGNSLRMFGADGYKVLREFHAMTNDKFLAYQAWQVLYQVQDFAPKTKGFSLVDEETAVKNHQYAPEFPGWRANW